MTTRNWAIAVGVAALLMPVALALAVFPTAMVDTRELYAWGRFFPLTTLKHPPLAAWLAGLTELVLPANAFSAILVGQIVNAIGVVYLHLTLTMVVDRERATLFAFLYATSLYLLLAPLSYALNSDILQVTAWLAVVYHFARAEQSDAVGHWLALGIWSAAAVLTKYTAGILFFAGAVATLIVPEYRRIWRNPKLWAAVAVGVGLLIPHLLALRADSAALAYAGEFAALTPDIGGRLMSIAAFAGGVLMFMAPGWIVIAAGFLNGNCMRAPQPTDPDQKKLQRFLLVLAIVAIAASIALALVAGSLLTHRYGAPFFGLLVLAAAPLIAFNPVTLPVAGKRVIAIGGVVAAMVFFGALVAYGVFTSHNFMQEPTEEAARIVRADWDRAYACGPGYILGDRSTAHGLAIAGDRHPYGLPLSDIGRPGWFDAERLQEEGAVVAYRRPIPANEVAKYLPSVAIVGERSFTLPLLRTRHGDNLTYHYFFIPPRACAIAPG